MLVLYNGTALGWQTVFVSFWSKDWTGQDRLTVLYANA